MAKVWVTPNVIVALLAAGLFTTVGLAIGGETSGWVTGILTYLCLLYAMIRVPLRYSLFTLMFLAYTLENPAEGPACNLWRSPIYPVGALLLNHMNTMSEAKFLTFSGMDVFLVTLFAIALSRKGANANIDRLGSVPTPRPLVKLALVSLGGTALVWLGGLARGGDFGKSLWQIDRVMYLPLIFLLFHMGLRGPQDHKTLAKVVLAAAMFRAVAAVVIIKTIFMPDPVIHDMKLPYATSHHDSILFATAFLLVFALLIERVGKHPIRRALFILPVLAAGIVANGRRMAWVQVALTFLTIYFVTPDNRGKRVLRKILMFSAPLVAVYVAAGWNSSSSMFKAVRVLRTVVDAKSDGSTMWRELENFNLILTLRLHPILGVGYGHGYEEVVQMPAIDYSLEKFVPHNSILGMWAYAGYFGFSAMTLLWATGVYFAMRAYHYSTEAAQRAAALVASGAVLIYFIQCWGDMGLGTWTGVFTTSASLCVAGKLAAATGAWPTPGHAASAPARSTVDIGARRVA